MSDTFWVDDAVLVTRDGVVGVDAEAQWTWSWTRPSYPDVEHMVRYLPRPKGEWLRGIRVAPGGWSDLPMLWPYPRDRDEAEEWVTELINREPK